MEYLHAGKDSNVVKNYLVDMAVAEILAYVVITEEDVVKGKVYLKLLIM